MIQTIPFSLQTIEATGYQNQWKYRSERVLDYFTIPKLLVVFITELRD